jgi:dihydroorotate dehydrogenase electron transfer subunit
MIHTKAEILLNQEIVPDHFKMVLALADFKDTITPGQFFHVRAGSDYDPLLRRPISVHRLGSKPNIVELLYKVVGKGTHLMSRRSKGTYLDLIGPLGNGFKIPKTQSNFILVAGGMGVAPLVALADQLARFRKRSITVILGAKTKGSITCKRELQDLGAKLIIITEDGSEGEKGLASHVLEGVIEEFDLRKKASEYTSKDTAHITIGDYHPEVGLYVCGPIGMLREIAKIARQYRIQTQASLEERMGCGLGACLGCVIKTKQGYKRVCKDGPVFGLEEIAWE